MVENLHMIIEKATKLGVVAYTCNPTVERLRQEGGHESQVSLN